MTIEVAMLIEHLKAKPAPFKANYDTRRVRSIEQMIANVANRAEQVIDARAADRF